MTLNELDVILEKAKNCNLLLYVENALVQGGGKKVWIAYFEESNESFDLESKERYADGSAWEYKEVFIKDIDLTRDSFYREEIKIELIS